ncbi:MAG: 23S rRNA (pseudouridine(1915)-N(3))-methyltransferase RlmH, partial [Rhodobacter sp.]|nr:23S rRNA (pseudouridine(1915)-N(3))-methyltransferase RlmH [Rhodobacter sp.]
MRLHVCSVGRLRVGPERELTDDYLARAERTGRSVGFGRFTLNEIGNARGIGRSAEATLLRRAVPDGARVVALDERGAALTSPEFARQLGEWR